MEYLLEPEAPEEQLDSLLDEELSTAAQLWPCTQGAGEPAEDALKPEE